MEPVEALSEAVIDILKEFSSRKLTLTSATLREAFAGRRDIVSLLDTVYHSPANGIAGGLSGSYVVPPDLLPAGSGGAVEPEVKPPAELREAFLSILDNLAPVIKGEYESRFSGLQKKIDECESLSSLSRLGEEVGTMVGELINLTVEGTDYSNDFLFELSKDLYAMEEQLSTYQEYNKETYHISSEFNNHLLSHTNDIHQAFDSGKSPNDIRHLIAAKLNAISKSIETKRGSDELRQKETDSKIAELQNNLRTYEQEVLQVRKRSESLEKEVLLDELTQISNRRSYDLQIKECLRHYHRTEEQFSLILIDIDHFKQINDNYGHRAGDKCLKEIAQLIKSALRQSDFFARYGGEELIAILHGCGVEAAQNVAEKIRWRVEHARFYYHDETIPVTISLGVTEAMLSDADSETPFIRVDGAMYRAKEGGRNRVCSSSDPPSR